MDEDIELSAGEIALFQRTCWYKLTADAAGIPVLALEGGSGRIATYRGKEAEAASRRLEWWRNHREKLNGNVRYP